VLEVNFALQRKPRRELEGSAFDTIFFGDYFSKKIFFCADGRCITMAMVTCFQSIFSQFSCQHTIDVSSCSCLTIANENELILSHKTKESISINIGIF
jgi:hypothetical protein